MPLYPSCDSCYIGLLLGVSAADLRGQSSAAPAYHAASHTSTEELAGIAGRASPELPVLYHQLFGGATDEDLVREVRQRYSGEVVSARDLDVF